MTSKETSIYPAGDSPRSLLNYGRLLRGLGYAAHGIAATALTLAVHNDVYERPDTGTYATVSTSKPLKAAGSTAAIGVLVGGGFFALREAKIAEGLAFSLEQKRAEHENTITVTEALITQTDVVSDSIDDFADRLVDDAPTEDWRRYSYYL
jgi:hypothetical protein